MKKNVKTLLTFKVTDSVQLIAFIMDKMHGISRNRAKALISNRVVLVNNTITTHPLAELKPGDVVQLDRSKHKHAFHSKDLDIVYEDDDVKAVVFRVNSPGGSADASEQIWHAMKMLQDKGLHVVVSMGDYAASGGYYISCNADYIYAEPTTLTGSIGIFGTVPNFNKLLDKVGLDIDGVSTNKHSALNVNAIYKGMNPQEMALMQNMVERGYDLFTRRCADGRGMTQDEIKKIGEGRVWLGKDALEIGLVDSLGNINDAIAKAVELAELNEYQLVTYPEKTDPIEEMLKMFDNSTPEERLIMEIREFASKPRIMTLMPQVTIQ